MQYHAKAALTARQRAEVQELYRQGVSKSELARRFHVARPTIQRWIERTEVMDRSSAPRKHGGRVVTEEYRAAVLAHRQASPTHGPKRIAYELRERFPTANTATIWRVLHAAGLSTRAPKKTAAPSTAGRTSSGTDGHSGTASHPRQPQA